LLKMGGMAAQILLDRIEERGVFTEEVAIVPELIVRRSTGVPRQT
jgi:DNA-binding LacI/PurR family transcriptional regulator